jgi:hypothetical protein
MIVHIQYFLLEGSLFHVAELKVPVIRLFQICCWQILSYFCLLILQNEVYLCFNNDFNCLINVIISLSNDLSNCLTLFF